jgi:hypothetical protein
MRSLRSALLIFVSSALPAVALAQSIPTTFQGLAGFIIQWVNALIAMLVGVAIIYYLYGILNTMRQASEGRGAWQRLSKLVGWGLVAFLVMFGVWGIVRILGNTLFGTDNFSSLG